MLCPATSMFHLTIYLGDYSILVHKEPCHSFFNGFMVWIYVYIKVTETLSWYEVLEIFMLKAKEFLKINYLIL